MYNIGIIDEDFSNSLKKMAKFRNKLVHIYWEIDDKMVYDIIKNNINDIEKFMKIIANYIKNSGQ